MKWCNRFKCWCDDAEEIIDNIEMICDQDCGNCEDCEEVLQTWSDC